jgi:hypothetical protein
MTRDWHGSREARPRKAAVGPVAPRRRERRAVLGLLGAAMSAVLVPACSLAGLLSKDVTFAQTASIGGPLPSQQISVTSASLSQQLEANAGSLSSLSSVTLSSAVLESTDGMDLSFLGQGTLTLSGNGLPTVTLATLPPPGAVGIAAFQVTSGADLIPYLTAGGLLSAALAVIATPPQARGIKLTLVLHASL